VRIKIIDDSLNETLKDINTGGKYKCINIILGSHQKGDLPEVTKISSVLSFVDLEVTTLNLILGSDMLVPMS